MGIISTGYGLVGIRMNRKRSSHIFLSSLCFVVILDSVAYASSSSYAEVAYLLLPLSLTLVLLPLAIPFVLLLKGDQLFIISVCGFFLYLLGSRMVFAESRLDFNLFVWLLSGMQSVSIIFFLASCFKFVRYLFENIVLKIGNIRNNRHKTRQATEQHPDALETDGKCEIDTDGDDT